MRPSFFEMRRKRWFAGARVCVGLDTDPARLPIGYRHTGNYGFVAQFNTEIVIATKKLALAYKFDLAFYAGRHQAEAQAALRETVDTIRQSAPSVPVIMDTKRATIGKSNAGYVAEAFDYFDADAVTVHPYVGIEALRPFLDRKDKGIFVLCRTSDPGSEEFQEVTLMATDPPNRSMQMYEYVAERVAKRWNYNGNCGLVVGATQLYPLSRVREIVGDMDILIPGVGAQGGDAMEAAQCGRNSKRAGIIISSSSDIIFASSKEDFASAAYGQLVKLHGEVNAGIEARTASPSA